MSYKGYKTVSDNIADAPENTHLAIENSANTFIYFVSKANNKVLKKINIATGAITTVTTAVYDIISMYPDLSNNKIWCLETQANGAPGAARMYYLNTINDAYTYWFEWAGSYSENYDIFLYGGNDLYVFQAYFKTVPSNIYEISILDVDSGGAVRQAYIAKGDWTGKTWRAGYVTGISTSTFYFLHRWDTENVKLYKFIGGGAPSLTVAKDCGTNTDLPDSKNQRGIAYDGSDLLYFILKNTSDSKNYLYTYSISTDTLTTGGQYDIALMMIRNVASGNMPKGFEITKSGKYWKIWEINSDYKYLLNIANSEEQPVSITDNKLFYL